MNLITVCVAATALLIPLIIADVKDHTAGKLIFKPLLSALFIVVAWMQAPFVTTYAGWVLIGLILSWVGDVFLIFSAKKLFLAGLVSFLLGHVCYASGFFIHGTLHIGGALGTVAVVVVSGAIFFWLRPHLGNMQGPVIAYILVITAMVSGALAIFSTAGYGSAGRWCVLVGAVNFYISDILVARDRFVASGPENRIYGLPPYYLAQFLFAFSIGNL